MFIFIKFLIYLLQTIDGKKNTAKPYLDYVNNKQFDRIKRVTGSEVSKTERFRLLLKSEEILFSNIVKKYFIVKCRLKISFMAMKNGMSVKELFFNVIGKIHRMETLKVKFDHPLELGFVYKLLNLRVQDLVKLGGLVTSEQELESKMEKEDEDDLVVHNIRQVLSKDKVEDMFVDQTNDDDYVRSPEDKANENAKYKFKMRMIEQKLKKISLFL